MTQTSPLPAGLAAFPLPPELDTPTLVVDVDRLEANVARMAALATGRGVALRPHAKTHKCPPVARRQLAHGAVGLTVATLGEAEAFADGGCTDVFVAYPVWAGGSRAARLRELHERVVLSVGVDSAESAALLAAAVRGSARPLSVLIELDCGGRRTGVSPAAAGRLAATCLRLGLRVSGAFTHPGHAYAKPDAVAAAADDERAALAVAAAGLRPLLDHPPVLSGGSTPTAVVGTDTSSDDGAVTEQRPGTYVFGDRQQVHLTGLSPADVALAVAARVVSAPRQGVVVIDAGSKALASDRPPWLDGHGWLPGTPDSLVTGLTEEHAVVQVPDRSLSIGDLVAVVPNHVCTAVNLGTEIVAVSGGVVQDVWPVASAR